MPTEQKTFFNLPVGIWLIGLVGFLMNLSTIMVFGVMPVFMSEVLGATDATITTIDGIVELLSYLCRIFSGALGDILHNRKLVLGIGFTLATLIKPVFAMAASVGWILGVRAVDRISNGIQASPRDALIADLAPPTHRGAAFGLGKSLKTIGSVIGAFITYLILEATCNDFRLLFTLAAIPAFLGLILFIFKVKEPRHRDHFQVKVSKEELASSPKKSPTSSLRKFLIIPSILLLGSFATHYILKITINSQSSIFNYYIPMAVGSLLLSLHLFIFKNSTSKNRVHSHLKASQNEKKFNWKVFRELRWPFWKLIILAVIVQFPHFSESALTLRAKNSGLEISITSFIMLVFNLGQFTMAYPLGRLSDRVKRHYILILGCTLMIGAHLCLAFNINHYLLFAGVALWGAQLAITQSILVAMISDVTPQYIRGTAFGIFYVVSGLVYFTSTQVANYLGLINSRYPFFNGALISFIAILVLASVKFVHHPAPQPNS